MKTTSPEEYYTTPQVAKLAGATHRQLQWWDEKGIIKPRFHGGRRIYTKREAMAVCAIADLRAKRLPLQKIRMVLPSIIRATWADEGLYLVITGRNAVVTDDKQRIIDECRLAEGAVYVTSLRKILFPGKLLVEKPNLKRKAAARFGFVPKRIDYGAQERAQHAQLDRARNEENFLLGPPREY